MKSGKRVIAAMLTALMTVTFTANTAVSVYATGVTATENAQTTDAQSTDAQVLTPEEIDPSYDGRVNLLDSEAVDAADTKNMKIKITRSLLKAYEEALEEFRAEIKSFCAKRGADFVSVNTEIPIEKMLFGELLKVGIME